MLRSRRPMEVDATLPIIVGVVAPTGSEVANRLRDGTRLGVRGLTGAGTTEYEGSSRFTHRRQTAAPALTRGLGARILRIWDARTNAYHPILKPPSVVSGNRTRILLLIILPR